MRRVLWFSLIDKHHEIPWYSNAKHRGIGKEWMLVVRIQPASRHHKESHRYTCNTMNTGPNRGLYANDLFILITPTSINRSIIHVDRRISSPEETLQWSNWDLARVWLHRNGNLSGVWLWGVFPTLPRSPICRRGLQLLDQSNDRTITSPAGWTEEATCQ